MKIEKRVPKPPPVTYLVELDAQEYSALETLVAQALGYMQDRRMRNGVYTTPHPIEYIGETFAKLLIKGR
jgi:hypothetical protein